jgi:hypothetical protein
MIQTVFDLLGGVRPALEQLPREPTELRFLESQPMGVHCSAAVRCSAACTSSQVS